MRMSGLKTISCLVLFMVTLTAFSNHSTGLHLQFPTELVDINRADIQEIHVFQTSPSNASLMLTLRQNCAAKLRRASEKAMGEPVVWIWNGRVLSMSKLQVPLDRDLIVQNFPPEEAEEFSKRVNKSLSITRNEE